MNHAAAPGPDAVLLGLDLAVLYLPELCCLAGALVILLGWVGWRQGRRWSSGAAVLLVRHPQYLGVLLIALGLLVRWATLPLLSIWPLLLLLSSWVAGQDRFGPGRTPRGSLLSRLRERRR